MGSFFSKVYWVDTVPKDIPPSDVVPTFDPNLGFKNPRKPRVSKLSEQEMKALLIEPEKRDYCAHYLRDWKVCIKGYNPFYGVCFPELKAYKHCLLDDKILRMKEYEREKRLRQRELRLNGEVIQ